jgi:acyl-CoA synthetase (AMP-forming)/AMP-acid ligase II
VEHVYRSQYPDVDIPEVSLTEAILGRAAERGDKPALIDGPSGRKLTYRALAEQVRRVAAGLAGRGFGKGDVFAIISPNLPEFAVAFHAVASLGGVVTTINPLSTAREMAGQLRDAGATNLLTVPPLLEAAGEAAATAGVRELFVFGEADGATPFASLAIDGQPPPVAIDPRADLVVLPYSSGTTGLPKGVMLTHYNLVANDRQMIPLDIIREDDTLIAVLPFFHIYGMTVIMNGGLARGATVVTMPRFDLEQFLSLIQQQRVTRAFVVPPIVLALAKHPLVEQYDLSSLRMILSGAAPLGAELTAECAARVGCVVRQGYGMTESSPVTHASPPNQIRPGTIGTLAPNTEARIVDIETLAPLGPGQTGELWVRGPQVMRGYLNQPQATAETIVEGPSQDSGQAPWLRTGDIAAVNEDGQFTVVDRLKELIKYKGYQVAPAELEALLLTHPAVGDAAVIGIPDEESGEVPKAFVVTRADVAAEALLEHVNTRVAPHKRLRALDFTDQIPKSASGKILRRVLAEQERTRATAKA